MANLNKELGELELGEDFLDLPVEVQAPGSDDDFNVNFFYLFFFSTLLTLNSPKNFNSKE
jgi:hypothetical protein